MPALLAAFYVCLKTISVANYGSWLNSKKAARAGSQYACRHMQAGKGTLALKVVKSVYVKREGR